MSRIIFKYGLVLLFLFVSTATSFAAPGIADLSAGTPTVSAIPLSWSVGSGGPATAYELRYSTTPFNAGSFASAVPLGGVLAPTGGAESHTVSGLACGTKYWFAVMAYDAAKSGGLSNVVKASTSACAPSFADAVNYGLPGSPHASAMGDFNNDGKPDLAFGIFSNTGSNYVSVMLGNGGGTFQSAVNYETGNVAGTYFLATDDLNRDGRLDLVAANWLAGNISIFIGNGDGTFLGAVNYTVSQGASSVATGDFNGDGKLDLAVTIQDQSEIKIFPGNGDGTFGSAATYSTDHPMMIAARDFNRDGKLDLAVTNRVDGTVSIRLGNDNGTFQDAASYATGSEPLGIVTQDINSDGKLDLLVSSGEVDGSVFILLGNDDGAFQPYTTHQGGDPTSRYVALSDINGDGIADLIGSGSGVYVSVGNGDGTFKPAVNFSAGTGPIRTVLNGDFNDDGNADMATANYGGSNASILLNTSNWSPAGSFFSAPSLATGTNPSSVKTADLNGDGRLDLVTSNEGGGNADVFYGNGDGTFQPAVTLSAGFSPDALTIADFNRDGMPDLLLINDSSSVYRYDNSGSGFSGPAALAFGINNDDVTAADINRDGIPDLVLVYNNTTAYSWAAVHLGNGDGGFGAETAYTAGSYANSVTAGDFNRDGITDLATGNFDGNNVSILLGKSDGTFHAAVNYATGANPVTLATADFNGDGKPDLAVPNYGGTTVSVLLGNGDGTFQTKTDYEAEVNPQTVLVGDIDRDGKSDLVVASRGGSFISILRGRGDGSFLPAESVTVGLSPIYPALGDFNGDGKPDIAVANYNSSTVSILLNTAPLPTVPQQGVVALWRGENNALDSIGGNHGANQGGTTYAAGKFGQAFSLDGEDDYIEIPNSPSLNPASAITVEAWYRPVSFAGNGINAIVSKGSSSHTAPYYEYHLGVNGDQYISPNSRPGSFSFSVGLNGSHIYVETAANTWVPGNWYNIVGTYDGSFVKLYVNGVLQASTPASGTLQDYGKSVRIGAFNNISSNIDYTPGLIDEVAIYNRAITANEAATMSGMVPNPFTFTPQTGMPLSEIIVSNPVIVTGISSPTAISVSVGGEYLINGGECTASSGIVNSGDTVAVCLTSAGNYLTPTTATLTIGGVEGTFSVTTLADTEKPVVNEFTISATESTTMAVDVTFTASDLGGVSGYMITDSSTPPSTSDPAWSASAPTKGTLSMAGTNTLYAWAKDSAGNVSDPLSDTVLLKPVRRGTSSYTYYDSIASACSEALTGETIKSLAVTVLGNVTISGGNALIQSGGHADGYGSQSGVTVIQGTLTVGTGSLTVDRVAVR